MKPISSTWPTSAQLGPPAAPTTRAKLVPTVSPQTSAKAPAASRQTAAARSSRPDGRGAFLREAVGRGRLGRYSFVGSGSRIVYANEAEAAGEPVVGYLAYDYVAKLEPTVQLPSVGPGLPESRFVVAETLVRFDHAAGAAEVLYGDGAEVAALFATPAPDTAGARHRTGPVRRLPDQATYEKIVRRAKE